MHILYIHQFFVTPKEAGGTRSYWIARELVEQGHKVTMLTSNRSAKNNSSTKIEENIDGIDVVYLHEAYDQKMSKYGRIRAFLKFVWKSKAEIKKYEDIDLVIATSTPLTIGFPALYLKWRKKTPFIFEVRDLWPEGPIQMGIIRNPVFKWALRKFERLIYENAAHIIALSPGMQDGVTRYVDKNKTSMIPNMSKIDEFWPREKDLSLNAQLGLGNDTFKVIHFGTIGISNGVESIINTASLMKEDKSVEFIFLGSGSNEDKFLNECRKNGLKNVHFLGRYPMKETSEIVNLCQLSIVSFKDIPILRTNSPNKFFDSLSAGKPVIVNSAGWTKDIVEQHNCGFYVNPNKPEELMQKIKFLQNNPSLVTEMGTNARNLAVNTYDKKHLVKQFTAVVNLFQKA